MDCQKHLWRIIVFWLAIVSLFKVDKTIFSLFLLPTHLSYLAKYERLSGRYCAENRLQKLFRRTLLAASGFKLAVNGSYAQSGHISQI